MFKKRTNTGRVVYDRKRKSFGPNDVLRIYNNGLTAEEQTVVREAICGDAVDVPVVSVLNILNRLIITIADDIEVPVLGLSLGDIYVTAQGILNAILKVEALDQRPYESLGEFLEDLRLLNS